MDIWTDRLERRDLPALERWAGRTDGAMTPNDLPPEADGLLPWFEICSADPERLDCLALVYETPVGVAGLRWRGEQDRSAQLYLLLGEVNYNPLRTATYVTLRMLDRAFLDLGLSRVTVRAYAEHNWFPDVLEQMGFSRMEEGNGVIPFSIQKDVFLSRKYLY